MEDPHDILKVTHNVVSKELARFRPCDAETRCYFCREWAQFIQKKHFSWSTRNQADAKPSKQQQRQQDNAHTLSAGRYMIKLDDSADDTTPYKAPARELFADFKAKLKSKTDETDNHKTDEVIQACEKWIAEPSRMVKLPTLFQPVEFVQDEAVLKKRDEPTALAKLLDPLVIDRHHITFPVSSFQLLRNLTADVLQNYTDATCGHTRPEFKTPSELDVERDIYNENLQRELKTTTAELEQALNEAYSHLSEFIAQVKTLEKERCTLMGPECQKSIDYFAAKQDIKPFADYWAGLGDFKKQKATVETIDGHFNGYFDQLIAHVTAFQTDFANIHLDAACALMQKTWDLVVSSVRQMAERMNTVKPDDKGYAELCNTYLSYVNKYNPVEVTRTNVEDARKDLDTRVKDYFQEIEEIKKMYREESRATTAGRVEKVSKGAFKKLIKKVSAGYYPLRQHFRYLMTQKVLSEVRFCACLVVGMEALMQEVEVREAAAIKQETKRFLESHQEMAKERERLYEDFSEGIATGRTELAAVIGRLILKETMRVQGDSIAKQRQSNLLESLGLPTEEDPDVSKKKRARKKKPEPETQETTPNDSTAFVAEKEPPKEREPKKAITVATAATAEAKAPAKAPAKVEPQPEPTTAAVETQETPKALSPTTKQKASDKLPSPEAETPSPIPKKPTTPTKATSEVPTPPSKEPEAAFPPLTSKPPSSTSNSDGWGAPPANTLQTDDARTNNGDWTQNRSSSPPSRVPKSPSDSKADGWGSAIDNTKVNGWGTEDSNTEDPWSKAETSKQGVKNNTAEKKQKEEYALKTEETSAKSSDWNKPAAQNEGKNGGNVTTYATAAKSNQTSALKETGWGEVEAENGWNSTATNTKANRGWDEPSTDSQRNDPAVTQPQVVASGWDAPAEKPQHAPASGSGASTTDNTQEDKGWGKPAEDLHSYGGWGAPATETLSNTGWDTPAKDTKSNGGWDAPAKDTKSNGGWDAPAKDTKSNSGWGAPTKDDKSNSGWDAPAANNTEVDVSSSRWSPSAATNTQSNPAENVQETRSEDNAEGGWRSTTRTNPPSKNWRESDNWSRNKSYSNTQDTTGWSKPGTHRNAYQNNNDRDNWKSPYKRSDEHKQNSWRGNNEGNWNNTTEDNHSKRDSRGWNTEDRWNDKPKQRRSEWNNTSESSTTESQYKEENASTTVDGPVDISSGQQHQQQHQQHTQQEVGIVSVSLDTLTQQQLPRSQPPGLGVPNTLSSPYSSIQPPMLQQQQPVLKLISIDEIRNMSLEHVAGLVQNLQQDYNRLHREMELMKITLACQQQQNQLDQARNQTEKEGYIQVIQTLRGNVDSLQNKLMALQQQQQQQTSVYNGSGGSVNGGITAGFGGQDLFSGLRQEITSSHPQQHHQYHRGGKRHLYGKHVNARCSNCGDFNHSSSECSNACRYCGSSEHLSEACQQA